MKPDNRPSLTISYQAPENMPLEEKIMDQADLFAEEMLYPFQEDSIGVISVRLIFPNDKNLMEFKKMVVEIAFQNGVYLHFGP